MHTIKGNHILVHQLNVFFAHMSEMIVEHFDNPAWSDSLFVLGGHTRWDYTWYSRNFPGKRIIVYQSEQLFGPDGGNNFIDMELTMRNLETFPEVWDYDEMNAEFLRWYSIPVKYVLPMLHTERLRRIKTCEEPQIDVLFYGLMNYRRWLLMDYIQRQCYGELKLVWVYGEPNMDAHIANSKVILNLHAFEPWNRQEQVRMFYPVINGKTVVSEPSQANRMAGLIVEADVYEMGRRLKELCATDEWRTFGAAAARAFEEKSRTIALPEP